MASNSNIVDLKWMSKGGLLLDSSGDIAFTDSSLESLTDMVVTRLNAALYGFKQYNIGSDLDVLIGSTVDDELEIAIQKQVTQSLTNQFLPIGALVVNTIKVANIINIYVYVQGSLIASKIVTVG